MKPVKSHEQRCGYWRTVARIPHALPPPMSRDALCVIDAENLLERAITLKTLRRWANKAKVSQQFNDHQRVLRRVLRRFGARRKKCDMANAYRLAPRFRASMSSGRAAFSDRRFRPLGDHLAALDAAGLQPPIARRDDRPCRQVWRS
jgi:hypothetical protein